MAPTAAEYAQMRRDAESQARDDLKSLIPDDYLENVPVATPTDNVTTKVLKAAVAYTRDNLTAGNTTSGAQATNTNQSSPQNAPNAPILPTTPPQLKTNQEYQALKQAMERVKHNIQGRVAEEGDMSNEVKQLMDDTNSALVDLIHRIEGNRAEDA